MLAVLARTCVPYLAVSAAWAATGLAVEQDVPGGVISILREFGFPVIVALYLVWQSGGRELRMSNAIRDMEAWQRTELKQAQERFEAILDRNTEAIARNSEAFARVTDAISRCNKA